MSATLWIELREFEADDHPPAADPRRTCPEDPSARTSAWPRGTTRSCDRALSEYFWQLKFKKIVDIVENFVPRLNKILIYVIVVIIILLHNLMLPLWLEIALTEVAAEKAVFRFEEKVPDGGNDDGVNTAG